MNLRFSIAVTVAVVVLAGCGGSKTPAPVAGNPSAESNAPANPETASVASTDTPDGDGLPATSPVGDSTSSPEPIDDLMSSLQEAVEGGDFEGAMKLVEQALVLEPESLELLFAAVQLKQRTATEIVQGGGDRKTANGHFLKSAEFARRFVAVNDELGEGGSAFLNQVFYNEACAYATNGENDKALAALQDAFEVGFEDFQLVETDEDLAELHKNPEFTQMVASRRAEHQERRLAEIKEEIAAQEPFDFDFDLVSTEGKAVKMSDFKGKVLIVDFWGTWCPPCRMEIPHFVELLNKHRSAGLEMVGINYEHGDPAGHNELITTFAKENGINYPCVLGDEITQNRVPDLQGFPTTIFIDRSGKVRLQIVGYHPYDHLEAIVQLLLAEGNSTTGG